MAPGQLCHVPGPWRGGDRIRKQQTDNDTLIKLYKYVTSASPFPLPLRAPHFGCLGGPHVTHVGRECFPSTVMSGG